MMNGYFFHSKQLRHLALLGLVMALSACGGGSDSSGTTTSPTTSPSAVLGANEVAPVSGRTTVVGPEAGGAAFAEGDPARNSIPTLTRVKNADVSTLFEAEKSTLMTEGAADYEILIKFPVFPTGDSTITVTVPDALVSKLTSTNAIVAYVVNGDISEPSPFDPVASTYDPSTKKLSFVLPKDYLSESAAGSGSAGEVTVKIGLAKTFDAEPTTTGTSTKSLGTSAYQTTLGFGVSKKLPCPVDGSNGCIETSRYGPRIGGSSPMHKGVDFRASTPIELFAVADGIIEIPKDTPWGTVDIIVSGVTGVTRYRYMHLSRTDVRPGQKVKAKDVIGLSGNTAPPNEDGTPRNLAPHLHFEIWQPMPLVTDGLKRRSITAKVDPFPYFIDKVSVDIPGNKTPGDTTVTDKFALELKGYDTDGRPVTTEIDNSKPGFISRMRPVLWAASTGSVTQQEKYDTSFHKSLGTYQISKDPNKRNLADIVMPSSEVNATVTAAWEGVMPEATYFLSTGSFWRGSLSQSSCTIQSPLLCGVALSGGIGGGGSGSLAFRTGTAEPNNFRFDGDAGIGYCFGANAGDLSNASGFSTTFDTASVFVSGKYDRITLIYAVTTRSATRLGGSVTVNFPYNKPQPDGSEVLDNATVVGTWTATPSNVPFPKCTYLAPANYCLSDSASYSRGTGDGIGGRLGNCDYRGSSTASRPGEWSGRP